MTESAISYPENILPRLRYRFCPMCTTPLERGVINDDRIERVMCPSCGWIHYPSNAVGVCCIVKHQGEIVAILPASSPPEAPAALPAGHCEYGEAPEQAAVREVREETGLVVEIERCLGWYFNPQANYPGPNVTFFFEAHSVGGEMRGSSEGRVETYPLDDFPAIVLTRRGSTYGMQLYRKTLRQES